MNEKMPEGLAKVHSALWSQVVDLHCQWNLLRAVFFSDTNRQLMNELAPSFFSVVQISLWEDVVLHTCRLLDQKVIKGNTTLTLDHLLVHIDGSSPSSLAASLPPIVERLRKQDSAAIRAHRNNRLAHLNLRTHLTPAVATLPKLDVQSIELVLEGIRDVMNRVAEAYGEPPTAFEGAENLYAADELLVTLKHAKAYRQRGGPHHG